MAYYSGTAASISALRTALLTHAQADGWTLTGDVLSKAGVFFQITENANNVKCLGCESNAVANPAPQPVMIGKIYERTGYPTRQISFPCNYEVFGFSQELYFIVNYDTDTFQWMAFGKSTVPGLPGQGGWCGATNGNRISAGTSQQPIFLLQGSINNIAVADSADRTCAVLFGASGIHSASLYASMNSWCNSGLDGDGWYPGPPGVTGGGFPGLDTIRELLWQQPSQWNSEAMLLPLRAWKRRPSYKLSLTADLEHARHLRLDNLNPGDILTLGPDKWKVFPWYRKDATERNGGTSVNHTGTFGWAIRYEGS